MQNKPQTDRASAWADIAQVLGAIPLVIWCFFVALITLFIGLAVWFNHAHLGSFTSDVLTWLQRIIVVASVLIVVKLLYAGYLMYHEIAIKMHERGLLARRVERASLQNEQLILTMDVSRQLPALMQYAMQHGHNVEVSARGEVKVTNYLSNLHTMGTSEYAALPEREEPEQLAPAVPTFREMLTTGLVATAIEQGKMILGYADGEPRYGSWLDLYSAGIGGVSGSGKSTTVRFLLFQAILLGAKLIMVDPHLAEEEESLAAQFKAFRIHAMPPCDDNAKEVAKRIRYLMAEYTRRKSKGIKGEPLLFVLDEFNALVRRLPDDTRKELADLMLTIAQEGRKFHIFAMVIAQRWSEQDLGGKNYGAAIRGSLASTLAHRFQDEEQARKLAGSREGPRCLELAQGHYLFRDTQGAQIEMITPYTVEADGAIIRQYMTENTVESSGMHAKAQRTMMPPDSAEIATKARRIMQLQASGQNKAEIIRELWGANPGASEAYKNALAEYQDAMRFIAERLGA